MASAQATVADTDRALLGPKQCTAAGRGTGVGRRKCVRHLCDWRRNRRQPGAKPSLCHRAHFGVRRRHGDRDAAHRLDRAALGPPHRLHGRGALRWADRNHRGLCRRSGILSAVLPGNVVRRLLRRGRTVLPFCGDRRRQSRRAASSLVMGHGGRRLCGRTRAAARHLDDGSVAALHLFAASYMAQTAVASS